MMRFLYLVPALLVISAVTAGLKVDGGRKFWREFLRSSISLLLGFVALGAAVFLVTVLIGYLP